MAVPSQRDGSSNTQAPTYHSQLIAIRHLNTVRFEFLHKVLPLLECIAHVLDRPLEHDAFRPPLAVQSRYKLRESVKARPNCLPPLLLCVPLMLLNRTGLARLWHLLTRGNMIRLLFFFSEPLLVISGGHRVIRSGIRIGRAISLGG